MSSRFVRLLITVGFAASVCLASGTAVRASVLTWIFAPGSTVTLTNGITETLAGSFTYDPTGVLAAANIAVSGATFNATYTYSDCGVFSCGMNYFFTAANGTGDTAGPYTLFTFSNALDGNTVPDALRQGNGNNYFYNAAGNTTYVATSTTASVSPTPVPVPGAGLYSWLALIAGGLWINRKKIQALAKGTAARSA